MADPKDRNPKDLQNQVDPENLENTRERLARADTSHSPAPQGSGTGSGPAGSGERGPADSAQAQGGSTDNAPPAAGASGLSSGLQPGGTNPKTGAGGTGEERGDLRTPGASS